MPETLWRASLVLALYRNRHVAQARYLQLATVRADGRPANRTVVFRGFLGDSERITAGYGRPQRQGPGAGRGPLGGGVLVFPDDPRAIPAGRPRGRGARGLGGRGAPAGPARRLARAVRRHPPELHLAGARQPRDPGVPFVETPTDPQSPSSTFGLIVLDPVVVDHLELDGSPQNRWAYRRDPGGQWAAHEINP